MNSETSYQKKYQSMGLKRVPRRFEYLKEFGKWWWWVWIAMKLSDLPGTDRFFTWLAAWPLGHYKNRVALRHFKPYISPKAQISCSDLKISEGCFIDDFVTIYSGEGGGKIILEKGVHIYRGTIIEVSLGGEVVLGKHSSIQANCNLNGYMRSIRIGQKVMIGPQCGFMPYQHVTSDLTRPMGQLGLVSKGDIVIENDVWLGTGTKVMDGVHIGQGSVIGANAVVTKDVPAFSIAVGVPARVIRNRGENRK